MKLSGKIQNFKMCSINISKNRILILILIFFSLFSINYCSDIIKNNENKANPRLSTNYDEKGMFYYPISVIKLPMGQTYSLIALNTLEEDEYFSLL